MNHPALKLTRKGGDPVWTMGHFELRLSKEEEAAEGGCEENEYSDELFRFKGAAAPSLESFLAFSLHSCQQLSSVLKVRGREVRAKTIEQTNGLVPLSVDDELWINAPSGEEGEISITVAEVYALASTSEVGT